MANQTPTRITQRLKTFLRRLPLVSILFGAVLGMPGWWAIDHLFRTATSQTTSSWELALGVILGGLVGWVIPEFIGLVRLQWTISKPMKAVLGASALKHESTTIFLGSIYPKDTNSFLKSVPFSLQQTMEVIPKTGMPWVIVENDARALGFIMGALAMVGKTDNVSIVRDDVGLDITESNLMCIGSIKNNHKTLQINNSFEKMPLKFRWDEDELVIVAPEDDRIWKLDDEYDYGIFAKMPNEYDLSKTAWFFAGLSSYATVACAFYLYKNWADIYNRVNDRCFAMVIKARRDNFQYAHIDYEVII